MNLEDTENSTESSSISSSTADIQESQTSDTEAKTEAKALPEDTNFSNTENKSNMRNLQKSDADEKLHNEILEKLDVIKKQSCNNPQDIQENNPQQKLNQKANLEKSPEAIQIENAISQDFNKIQTLVKSGLINSAQGQNLKKEVLKNAFDKLVQTEKIKRALSPALQQDLQTSLKTNNMPASYQVDKNGVFEEFSKNNPNFFASEGRKEVLNYLKSDDVIIGKDELSKISNIIRIVEKAAIERYLENVAHEKTLKNSNESAKQKLTANAQKLSSSGNISRTFTREQIGKMSSKEFAKYESAIMEQLKKGQIR